MYHQRRTTVADQLLDGLAFFHFIMVAVANQQKIAGVIGDLLHGFDHGAKKRIGDIAHHQADGFR